MQVKMDPKLAAASSETPPLSLKEGDVYQAAVKGKPSEKEALLQIRGQEIKVKVEGKLPDSGRVTVEVLPSKDGTPTVRLAETAGKPTGQPTADQVLTRLNGGQPLSADMKAAVSILMDKGMPLNKASLQEMKQFLGEVKGTMEQKLATVTQAANKQLPVTAKQLQHVHAALHESSIGEAVGEWLKEAGVAPKAVQPARSDKPADPIVQKLVNVLQTLSKHQPSHPALPRLMESLTRGASVQEVGAAIQKQFAKELKASPPLVKALAEAIQSAAQPERTAVQVKEAVQPSVPVDKIQAAAVQKITAVLKALEIMRPNQPLLGKLAEQVAQGMTVKEAVEGIKAGFARELAASPPLVKSLAEAVQLEAIAGRAPVKESASVQTPAAPVQPAKTEAARAAIQEAIRLVKKNPDMGAILKHARQEVLQSDNVPEALKAPIETGIVKAEKASEAGREMAARGELMRVLQEVEAKLPAPAPSVQPAEAAYTLPDELLAMVPGQAKDIIVTRVTEKMSQLTIDFKHVKRDLSRNLQTVDVMIQQFKQRSIPQVKPLLESTIHMLDKAILKGEFVLYTDMVTEKKLLKASSQLAEAKQLLMKGEVHQASRIVGEVKKMTDQLIFKPADVKVKHFVSGELLKLDDAPSPMKQTAAHVSQSLQMMHEEPTGRRVLEHTRALGLTYEHEQAQSLLTKGKPQEELSQSLKSMLTRMVQADESAMNGKADQVLSQLTGQQLLSKTDTSGMQSLMLSLPFLLQDKVENMKVFIQSKNSGQTIDWENCSLYFLFETKKLGEIGVSLTAHERNLSVKIRNDLPGFKERMAPLVDVAKERLSDVGYRVGSVQFTELTPASEAVEPARETKAPSASQPTMTEKGYDYTI